MTAVSLQERLEEATADLSRCQVAADVAEILRVEGVQGKRGDCKTCPVATLVLKRLGGGSVEVQYGEIYASNTGDNWVWVSQSKGVEAFIAEFDGEYDVDDPIPGGWDEFAVASP